MEAGKQETDDAEFMKRLQDAAVTYARCHVAGCVAGEDCEGWQVLKAMTFAYVANKLARIAVKRASRHVQVGEASTEALTVVALELASVSKLLAMGGMARAVGHQHGPTAQA
jgi:hypothetical protein